MNTDNLPNSFVYSVERLKAEALKMRAVGPKPLPQVVELEESIIGSLLLYKDAITEIIDVLKPEDFHDPRHQKIYRAILALFSKGEAIDERIIVAQLRKEGTLEEVGGLGYLLLLVDAIPASEHIETHAYLALEYSMKRMLIEVTTRARDAAYDDTEDIHDVLEKAQAGLFDIMGRRFQRQSRKMATLMRELTSEVEASKDRKDDLLGVPSGLPALDRMLKGWQKSDLIVLAGRPGMGKSALLSSSLYYTAVEHQHPVALFSLEMSASQQVKRMASVASGLSVERLKEGKFTDKEWELFFTKTAKLTEAPIHIDDAPAISLFELRAKCRRLKERFNIELAVVDFLQLMRGEGKKVQTREQEVSHIARGLKAIAKELHIPIIAASQLSRAVEARSSDKRPQLSDLRESGDIEQSADIVLMLYRPEYYGITQDEQGYSTHGLAEVIITKHRNGPQGSVKLRYIAEQTKFAHWQDGSIERKR